MRMLNSHTSDVRSAGVVGSGTMGAGIAMSLANAGIGVLLVDASGEALERARANIAASYDAQVSRGKLERSAAGERIARILFAEDIAALGDVDVAIEAVFEDLAIKRDVFAKLGAICRADALLATNTSTLDIDAIVSSAPHPERSLGMHFFSPAHVMKLLEVVRGSQSSLETIAAAVALGERIGKIPVVVGNCDGFVGNRMLLGYKREAEFAVLAGASPARVDGALEAFGFAMGPFAVSDLAGIDVGWRAKAERIKRGASPPFAVSNIPDAMVAANRLGQKTSRGFYRYEKGDRARYPDPEVDEIIATERSRAGIAAREIGDEEIVQRCVYALVLEGARILDDGIADSPGDIDTIWTNGYGFPKARGGPMRYAENAGLGTVLARMRTFAHDDPAFWRIPPALERAAAHGSFPNTTRP
jgi:3-hydroxyacyl-CoA dehydrogenase